jgi:hypothetical protein
VTNDQLEQQYQDWLAEKGVTHEQIMQYLTDPANEPTPDNIVSLEDYMAQGGDIEA